MEFVLVLFLIIMITGGIWMDLRVAKDSRNAALAWLFIPFYSIMYLSGHWDEMKKPFYVWLVGTGGIVITAVILSSAGDGG